MFESLHVASLLSMYVSIVFFLKKFALDILGLCLSLFIVYYKGIFYFVLEKFILLGFIFFHFSL